VPSVSSAEPCRLTIVGPRRALDVAIPADVPLAYLLPTLLQRCDPELADQGATHGGWALQRFGDPPLDIGRTALELKMKHGERLYLRPGQDPLQPLDVDDVVDTVATATAELPRRWGPTSTRISCLVVAGAAAAAGVGVLATGTPPWTVSALLAATATALLLALAAALSRAAGDSAGSLLGALAMPYAFVAGAAAVAGSAPALFGPGQVAAGFTCAALAAVLASAACAADRQWFLAGAIACAFGLGGAFFALPARVTAPDAGGLVVGLVLLCAHVVPSLAARAGGLPRPFVPTQPSDVKEQPPAPAADDVLAGVARTDRYVVAMYGAVAAVCAVGATLALRDPGWAGPALATLAALVLALRARFLSAAAARWLLLGAATTALALTFLTLAARFSAGGDGVLLVTTLAGAATSGWLAHRLPGHRVSPWWGRIGDLVEVAATLVAIPVCLQVAGVYGIVRALGG
jgi:type VII secretion integral membrane protein EccD